MTAVTAVTAVIAVTAVTDATAVTAVTVVTVVTAVAAVSAELPPVVTHGQIRFARPITLWQPRGTDFSQRTTNAATRGHSRCYRHT